MKKTSSSQEKEQKTQFVFPYNEEKKAYTFDPEDISEIKEQLRNTDRI